jgi:hypothetical protein
MDIFYLVLWLIIDFNLVRDEACFDNVIRKLICESTLAKEGSWYAVLKSISSVYLCLCTFTHQSFRI